MTDAVDASVAPSEPILAPEEIDALMQAVVPSEQADALFATLPPVDQPKEVEAFNFDELEQNGPDRYPLFNNLQQRMTESLKELWTETFQREIIVGDQGIEPRVYQDILQDDTDKPQVYFVYDVEGFGRMAVACELSLVVAYIDAMLGGKGEVFDTSVDVLSPVEVRLAKRIAQSFEKLLVNMWTPVKEMKYSLFKIEVEAQFLAIASSSDLCFSVQFELEIADDFKGEMRIHYPRTFLEPVLDNLRSAESDEQDEVDVVWEESLKQSLAQVPLTARLEFGTCNLDIKQFLGLRAGDFLPLSKSEQDPAILWVSSASMFEAMPGSQNGELAAELLTQLTHNKEI